MIEFSWVGNHLSWSGRRYGPNEERIQCKLDQAVGNEDCHTLYPHTKIKYLELIGSYHNPILAEYVFEPRDGRKFFWFDKRWVGKDGLQEAIESGWNWNNNASYEIVDRIIGCRNRIARWRKDNIPSGLVTIENLKVAFEEAQNDDRIPNYEIDSLRNKLKEAYLEEKIYWKQKSRNCGSRRGTRTQSSSNQPQRKGGRGINCQALWEITEVLMIQREGWRK